MGTERRVSIREEFVEAGNHRRLFLRSWHPTHEVRAAVAVVHGFNAHSAYYDRFASFLANRGIATHAVDLRGRGKSPGRRAYVQRFEDYVTDVEILMSTVSVRESSEPVFILGHSAGGVIACMYALAHQQSLAGLVCESVALDVPAPALELQFIKGLAVFAPRLPVVRLPNARFTRDERVVALMNNDPLIANERQPARTTAELVRAGALLRASCSQLTLPLLVLHGSADAVMRPSGSEYLHEHAGSRDKTLQIFEGYYHDLINDQGHELVAEKIFQWLDSRLNVTIPRTQIGIEYINDGT